MSEDDSLWTVRSILSDYVRSPSIRHIRDPHSIAKLSREIVNALDRGNSIWGKWDGQREAVLKSAMGCWIPLDDLQAFLNKLPGPNLTPTDVAQRLKAFEEEPFSTYPKEEFEAGCLEIYRKEKAQGTELPAIIGLLRDHVEQEEERLYLEQQERFQQHREKERIARESKLLSVVDCT